MEDLHRYEDEVEKTRKSMNMKPDSLMAMAQINRCNILIDLQFSFTVESKFFFSMCYRSLTTITIYAIYNMNIKEGKETALQVTTYKLNKLMINNLDLVKR